MSLTIDQRKSEAVTVVDLSGKIVLGEPGSRLLETVKQLVGQGERKIVCNLEGVSYMDSSGLGTLVNCCNAVTERQGRFKLMKVHGNIRDLLRITKLLTFFEIFEDETAAIQSFN